MISPNLVQRMIDFGNNLLGHEEVVDLFSNLIKTKLVWQLEGFYGRTARRLIDNGYISETGEINTELVNLHKHQ